MKIAFIHIGYEQLGIEYLSALLKNKGHVVRLFFDPSLFDDRFVFHIKSIANFFNINKYLIKDVINFNPELIAFSVFTDSYRWALDTASELKKDLNALIVFGGIHPTLVPEIVINEKPVDIVNIGEGFESMPELADAIDKKKSMFNIQNIWFKKNNKIYRNNIRPVFKNLNILPLPDKDIFHRYFNVGDKYLIMSSFGCPYKCTFCSNHQFLELYKGKGSFIRRRSPEHVIFELKHSKKRYGLTIINFEDDIFTIDKKWLKNFAYLYKKEIKLPYRVLSHTNYIDDEIVRILKNSGCYRIELGVQSVNYKTRKNILMRPETNETISRAFSICERHKLKYMVHHMLGIPTEDSSHQMEAANFYINHKPARISNFWLVYYPKTKICDYGLINNIISDKDIKKIENGYSSSYHDYGSLNSKVLRKEFKSFAMFFILIPILPSFINKRLLKSKLFFKLHLIPGWIQTILDFLGGVFHKDYYTLSYAKYYFKYMFKILLIKTKKLI